MTTPNPFRAVADSVAAKTDAEYASELSSLCRLKDSEIAKYFPTRADKNALLELLRVVNTATTENEKLVQLKNNIDKFAGVVVKLVKLLA